MARTNVSAGAVKTITLSMTPQAAISPLLYGANYVWSAGPEARFTAWLSQMQGANAAPTGFVSLIRYPGGWDGEWYDWDANTLYAGGPTYAEPGISPAAFLSAIRPLTSYPPLSAGWSAAMAANGTMRAASFQLPVRRVVEAPVTTDIPAAISQLISDYGPIISQYHAHVQFWEIGNEWWLQNGAARNTAPLSSNTLLTSNLSRYAALIAAAAPAIKAAYPSVKLYVTADWRTAGAAAANDEFVQLQKQVGAIAWADIDGISIHAYCGTNMQQSLCKSIPAQVKEIKHETGKADIFDSEWAVVLNQSPADDGLQNANLTVSALQDMAMAGIDEASYWPSIGFVPKIALTNGRVLTATGTIFQIMANLYQGQAITATVSSGGVAAGQTVAVAAKNNLPGRQGVAVIIPTNGDGLETINLSLAGTGLTKVSQSSVIYDKGTKQSSTMAFIAPLKTSLVRESDGNMAAQFVLNPGMAGRGSNWEIAVLELQ